MARLKFLRVFGAALFAFLLLWLGWYWAALGNRPVSCIHWPGSCYEQSGTFVWYIFAQVLNTFGVYDATDGMWLYTQPLPFVFGWLLRVRLGALMQRLWANAVDRI
jgi:hypothetical protein